MLTNFEDSYILSYIIEIIKIQSVHILYMLWHTVQCSVAKPVQQFGHAMPI